jgi:hypothetical protein
LGSLAFALSILAKASSPSLAAVVPKEELRANDIILNSLKPGISTEEAEKLAAGIVENDDDGDVVLGQASAEDESDLVAGGATKKIKMPKKSKQKSQYDYGEDEYEEEDDALDFEFEGDIKESDLHQNKMPTLTPGTTGGFAMSSQSKPTTKMYVTCAFSILVVPVTWLQTREFLRGRREQQYVEKGLKILQAQKAEYFNVTSETKDSDIEDELKDLKNKDDDDDDEDDDDDDDSDEDDEDDDEDDDRPSRPKKPRGGGPDDDDDDDDDGGDDDSGPPSDEDVDRLNKMFGKS